MPTANEEVMKVAAPRESSVDEPTFDVPSMNVTVPVGVPEAAVTMTAKVTLWPKTLGFTEEFSVTVATFLFTTCDNGAELLAVKLPSPA